MFKIQAMQEYPKGFFHFSPADYMVRSIFAGNTNANIYFDTISNPSVYVIHENYTLFIDGNSNLCDRNEVLNFVRDDIFTENVRKILGRVKIVYHDQNWFDSIMSSFSGTKCSTLPRSVFCYESKNKLLYDNADIHSISAEIMGNTTIKNREMIADEVCEMWGTVDAFLRNGFGVCTIIDNTVAGFCTAEYMSEGFCGIGIATVPEQRRKGYAYKMAAGFVNECIARNITPYWDCWTDNLASMKTADKANFRAVADYIVVLLEF